MKWFGSVSSLAGQIWKSNITSSKIPKHGLTRSKLLGYSPMAEAGLVLAKPRITTPPLFRLTGKITTELITQVGSHLFYAPVKKYVRSGMLSGMPDTSSLPYFFEAIQLNSSDSLNENLETAFSQLKLAKDQGALWCFIARDFCLDRRRC